MVSAGGWERGKSSRGEGTVRTQRRSPEIRVTSEWEGQEDVGETLVGVRLGLCCEGPPDLCCKRRGLDWTLCALENHPRQLSRAGS